jgi:UDP-glucose 4-epimerase
MADCLVIGGDGFLGSRVAAALVAAGHRVASFDHYSRGMPEAGPIEPIAGEFLDTAALRAAVRGRQQVYHFLSSTTPATAENDPRIDLATNVGGAIELFGIAADEGVERVAFASSGGAIYGDQLVTPISEEALPHPVSPYAIGKLAIESYLRYFERTRGLRSVSFRISNPYGPNQRSASKQGVIPIFLRAIAAGQPVTVFGNGSMVRDYLYVDDAAAMIASTADAEPQHAVYNIGSGHGTSITELVELTREVTGREVNVEYLPQPSTFVNRSIVDPSRLRDEFRIAPRVELMTGIASTWAAIRQATR